MSSHQLNREASLIAEAQARRLGERALGLAVGFPVGHPASGTLYRFSDALAVALRLAVADRGARRRAQ